MERVGRKLVYTRARLWDCVEKGVNVRRGTPPYILEITLLKGILEREKDRETERAHFPYVST